MFLDSRDQISPLLLLRVLIRNLVELTHHAAQSCYGYFLPSALLLSAVPLRPILIPATSEILQKRLYCVLGIVRLSLFCSFLLCSRVQDGPGCQ